VSQAVVAAPDEATARTVVAAGWLRVRISGEASLVNRVLHDSRALVFDAEGGPTHAHVELAASTLTSPRWPEQSPTFSTVEWSGSSGRVQMQCAEAQLAWDGTASDVLRGDVALDPQYASAAFETTLKLLCTLLGVVHRSRVLVHASVVLINGRAVLLLGDSQAGKSTTAERLHDEGLVRIADDAVFVEVGDDVCVFPYFGDWSFGAVEAPNTGWPLLGALKVAKGASAAAVSSLAQPPLSSWLRALLVPGGPPAYTQSLVDLAARLRTIPVKALAAPRAGALRPALEPFARS
jgi:hypothetical protein